MRSTRPTHLVLDLDPPAGSDAFARAVEAALLVRQALGDVGMTALVKTSGAKGVHVVVPLAPGQTATDVAAATRAVAARAERLDPTLATTAFVVEERERQGLPRRDAGGRGDRGGGLQPAGCGRASRCRSRWPGTTSTARRPADFTIATVPRLLGDADPWATLMPAPQVLDRRTGRGGAHDPGRPGGGDARGQAPSASPAGRGAGQVNTGGHR